MRNYGTLEQRKIDVFEKMARDESIHTTSTFAIWADSGKKGKLCGDKISFEEAVKAGELANIRFDRVILGMNPAFSEIKDKEFSAFHHAKHRTDRAARGALRPGDDEDVEVGRDFYGAFMTDLFCTITHSDASKAMKQMSVETLRESFETLMEKLSLVAEAGEKEIQVLALGGKAKPEIAAYYRAFIVYFEDHRHAYEPLRDVAFTFKVTHHPAARKITAANVKKEILDAIRGVDEPDKK